MNKINNKIMEEIIERALKYVKGKTYFNVQELVNAIMFVRRSHCYFDLLNTQRKNVINKKINQ